VWVARMWVLTTSFYIPSAARDPYSRDGSRSSRFRLRRFRVISAMSAIPYPPPQVSQAIPPRGPRTAPFLRGLGWHVIPDWRGVQLEKLKSEWKPLAVRWRTACL